MHWCAHAVPGSIPGSGHRPTASPRGAQGRVRSGSDGTFSSPTVASTTVHPTGHHPLHPTAPPTPPTPPFHPPVFSTPTQMALREDYRRATKSWRAHPRQRLLVELVALGRCFVPHTDNNNFRKITLLTLLGVWVAATFSAPTTDDFSTVLYVTLTALVFMIVGRQWGIEVQGVAPAIQLQADDSSAESDTDSETD